MGSLPTKHKRPRTNPNYPQPIPKTWCIPIPLLAPRSNNKYFLIKLPHSHHLTEISSSIPANCHNTKMKLPIHHLYAIHYSRNIEPYRRTRWDQPNPNSDTPRLLVNWPRRLDSVLCTNKRKGIKNLLSYLCPNLNLSLCKPLNF